MAMKKMNDDTLLLLIRDGNSPGGAARRLGVGRAAVSKRRERAATNMKDLRESG
ncbi:MAG: hypothetical protein ABSH41_23155 [Syntrophobacteraceae bacterium]|jgi:hypothetical protein